MVDLMRITPIVSLLFRGGPSTILRAVWPVIVDPVKRISLWLAAHVGVEGFKRRTPLFADSDATPTPPFIVGVSRVEAPLLHRGPRVVGWSMAQVVRDVITPLFESASAGFCSRAKTVHSRIATVTSRQPVDRPFRPIVAVVERSKRQLSIALASAVSWFRPIVHTTIIAGES